MKLPVSVVLAGLLFTASVWGAGSLSAANSAPEKDVPESAQNEKAAGNPVNADPAEPQVQKLPREQVLKITEKDIVIGKKDAPVSIFEYSSLSCPHCAHFHKETLPQLTKNYLDTGKANLVVRQFPLNLPATNGALLVTCLPPKQGEKFEQVLFNLQEKWAFSYESREALQKIAAVGGVGEKQFNACLDDKAAEEALLSSTLTARDSLGIESTPTFFVGEEKIEGSQPLDVFAKAIAKATPAPEVSAEDDAAPATKAAGNDEKKAAPKSDAPEKAASE